MHSSRFLLCCLQPGYRDFNSYYLPTSRNHHLFFCFSLSPSVFSFFPIFMGSLLLLSCRLFSFYFNLAYLVAGPTLSHQVMRFESIIDSRMTIGELKRDNSWDWGFAMAASLIVAIIWLIGAAVQVLGAATLS